MELVRAGASFAHEVDRFGSRGVGISPVTQTARGTFTRVVIAAFGAGSVLGRHEAGLWQLFAVIDGSGWVSGADDEQAPIERGWAALWSPGELHASGSDVGMVACIVESELRPVVEPRSGG